MWADSFVCYPLHIPIFKVKTLDKLPHYRAQRHEYKWSRQAASSLTEFNTFISREWTLLWGLVVSTFELKTISCPLNVPLDMEKRRPKRENTKLREESKFYTIKVLCFPHLFSSPPQWDSFFFTCFANKMVPLR